MDANWHETFLDFGEDPLMPFPRTALSRIEAKCTEELRGMVSRNAPKLPGVYGMLDATGRLIYVGKSKSLRNRLLSYFMPNNTDEKAGRIIQAAEAIVWEKQPSDFGALVREQMLIRRWQPRLNVVGMPKRQQQAFMCIGNPPAERFYLSKRLPIGMNRWRMGARKSRSIWIPAIGGGTMLLANTGLSGHRDRIEWLLVLNCPASVLGFSPGFLRKRVGMGCWEGRLRPMSGFRGRVVENGFARGFNCESGFETSWVR